ncbi:MAG: ATP-dependent DNA helicase RecG [Bdellovibrionota bacterium]
MKQPWDIEVTYLKGVGPKLAEFFAKADVHSFWDLLLFLPRTYEDRRTLHSYVDILKLSQTEEHVMGVGIIEKYHKKQAGPRGRRWTEALVRVVDPADRMAALATTQTPQATLMDPRVLFTWFYDPGNGIEKRFPEGTTVVFHGKTQLFRSVVQVVHPELQKAESELPPWEFGGFIPVYREISALSTRVIRRIMALALNRDEMRLLEDTLPESLRAELKLPDLKTSLRELHFPKRWTPAAEQPVPAGPYLQRVAFEELFLMSLALQLRKSEWSKSALTHRLRVPSFSSTAQDRLGGYLSKLPFELTSGQHTALQDIVGDISQKDAIIPMHRLVQGDVGSGKTIVAFAAALLIVDEGFQAAMMAPTEILADQHFQNFSKLFPERAHECLLLKGALTAKQKKEARAALSDGRARFVIGTQALLTDDTLFDNLGLIIVDEQHRFGVKQRILMKGQTSGVSPHLLVMTATPIPRSLALTIYGDLNISVIRDKPAGRIPIETHLVRKKAHQALAKRLGQFLEEGRQIYLVYPLVEESEEIDLKDVQTAHTEWSLIFGQEKVGLLHGRMKSKEKEAAMRAFKAGETRVLVSTTVIEVGVDVPNASVIVIEHAERFGLSQLHQLRGRVGRGATKSYCVLVGPDKAGPNVEERLGIMVESDDGFRIAEKDLEIRGPGEFLGRRQSGLPGFRVAHIMRDVHLLERAREEAEKILERDPELLKPEHESIRDMMQRWWGGRMELTLSG